MIIESPYGGHWREPLLDAEEKNHVSYWGFDKAAVTDRFWRHNLTPTGVQAFAAGKYGQCISFDGTAGKWLSRASVNLTRMGSGPFTVCGWIYFDSVAGSCVIMTRSQNLGTTGWAIFQDGGTSVVRVAGVDCYGSVTGLATQWLFWCARYTPSTEIAHWIGSTKTTNTSGIPASFAATQALVFNSVSMDAGESVWPLEGDIDEVHYWDKALSDAAIDRLVAGAIYK